MDKMNTNIKIKSIWFLQYQYHNKDSTNKGPIIGPLYNSMTNEGLEKLAAKAAELEAPYIAIGDTNGETFRKAVGAVIQNGAVLRFRATLNLSEANGDHTWLALHSNATRNSGSGIKINHLDQLFSKAQNQTLNIECRITFQQGVV